MRKFNLNTLFVFVIDLSFIYFAYFISVLLIHDFSIEEESLITVIRSLHLLLPIYFSLFYLFKFYKNIWEYASVEEAVNVFFAIFLSFFVILGVNLFRDAKIPLNLLIINQMILYILLISFRYGYRIVKVFTFHQKETRKKTLIIGAGSAGSMLVKEIKLNHKMQHKIIGFVDDDMKKKKKTINGSKVLGSTLDILYLVNKYQIEEIIVAIPSSTKEDFKRILQLCNKTNAKTKVFPPFFEVIDNEFRYKNIREVKLEDLLGREEVIIHNDGLQEFIQDEVVLVTGGGGSIGSEICRQVIKYQPKELIIFDVYENSAYEIEHELKGLFPNVQVLIGSIQDEYRLEDIFIQYKPTIIFHAAAHKHVPLMEISPKEAIKNNVFGTYHVVKLADKYSVKKFVLISSDKAVNPTSIMGATKRLCEMIIEAYDKISNTQFSAVRFGNVLGSNGSVIPLFKKQIENGGPVTVTHKDIIRYFMTIPEAVSLVLEAGAFALGGEIFVLNMGEPVKILDLAKNLIRYSGFEPYKDIDIVFTGLRNGEKLYEEILMKEEGLKETSNKQIYVLNTNSVDICLLEEYLEELKYLVTVREVNVKEVFQKMVPTYQFG